MSTVPKSPIMEMSLGLSDRSVNPTPKAIIMITLKGNVEDLPKSKYTLRQRGFVPLHTCILSKKKMIVAVSLSTALLKKMAILTGIYDARKGANIPKTAHARLAFECFDIILRAGINATSCWVMHDHQTLIDIMKNASCNQPEKMLDYFGARIAIYFSWLMYYTYALGAVALFALMLFIHATFTGEGGGVAVTLFCFFSSCWGIVFTKVWRGHLAELRYGWGVENAEKDEIARSLQSESVAQLKKESPLLRTLVSNFVVFISSGLIVWSSIYAVDSLKARLQECNPASTDGSVSSVLYTYLPLVIWAVLSVAGVQVAQAGVPKLATIENHLSFHLRDGSVIYKTFTLAFFSKCTAPVYAVVWHGDIQLVKLLVIGNVVSHCLMHILFPEKTITKTKVIDDIDSRSVDESTRNYIRAEARKGNFSVGGEFLEMVLQYSYVILFSSCLPLMPVMAFFSNFLEGSRDFQKLSKVRRPALEMRSNIGNWTNCIGFLNHIAIFVNGAIIALNRDSWISFLPLHWLPFDPSLLDGHIGTLLVIMFLEHVFECLSSAISYMSPENPIWIEQARSLELRRIQKKQEMNRIKQYLAKEYDDDVVMRKEQEREAAALKVATKYPKLFSLNPLSLGGLLILPVALSLVGMSPFLYTPLAFMYLSYMQVMKEKKDMRYTLDIITDPEIMDLVVKNQPDYINNPGKELTEWGNKMLQLMWPWIAQWVEQKVKDGIAPVLAKEKPFFIKKMNLVRCTPGPKAPRGIGVSVHDSVKDNNVIMDMDIVWVGEPEFEFQIQTAGPTITLSMTEFTFAAPMRFLCGPLVLGAPPFKTVGASCLKPPFVNFTFKINGLDITNASAGNMKIAQAIDRAMRKVIAQKLLYPNHLIIKLERSADVNLLKAKTPAGLLYVKLVSGSDLVVMDLIASDPYAMLTVGAVTQQSTVKGATLFPEWNESFDFLVHDKRGQVLEVRLFDQDTFSNDDPMGRVEIKISELKEFQKVTQDYTLEAVETGSLKLEVMYIPLQHTAERDETGKGDKLFNLSRQQMTEDVIESNVDEFEVATPSKRSTIAKAIRNLASPLSIRSNVSTETGSGSPQRDKIQRPPRPNRRSSSVHSGAKRGSVLADNLPGTGSVSKKFGVLTVDHIECRNLSGTPTSLSAYVNFVVEDNKKKTKVAKNQYDPKFDETFNFVVLEWDVAYIEVNVKNATTLMYGDRSFGEVRIPVSDVVSASGFMEKEHKIVGRRTDSFIKFRLCWSEAVQEELF